MNKSVLALAIAAALAAPVAVHADTTLYGSARVSVDWNHPGGFEFDDDDEREDLDDFWEVFNNSSRLGVRGSEDLGGGLSAIYQYEFGIDVTGNRNYFNSNRPRWVGLKGGFGAVTLGTQWTPYYNVLGYTDQFNSAKSFSYLLGTSSLAPSSLVGITRGIAALRKGNSLIYTTPDFGGFTAQAMLEADGVDRKDGIDTWELNAKWAQKGGGFTAGGAFVRDQVSKDQQYGILVGYDTKSFGVGFAWERYEPDDEDINAKINGYTLIGSYTFGNNVIRAAYNRNQIEDRDDIDFYELGYQYNLSKRTRVWAEYLRVDDHEEDIATIDVVSIGMRHDF